MTLLEGASDINNKRESLHKKIEEISSILF